MNLHLGLKFLFLTFATLIAIPTFAQEAEQDSNGRPPLVEVHHPQDNLAPYKERRGDHGFYFSAGYEDLVLKKFISGIDGLAYKDTYGSTGVPLIRLGLEYKYNMSIGALAAGVEAGMGEVSGKDTAGDRKLKASKYGVTARYVADMIMDEPYVAPYVGIGVWKMGLEDITKSTSLSEEVNGYNYTVGLLLQLDWIDYVSAKNATFNLGLENTFIDIYATQYASNGSQSDPDASTDFIFGASLRLEF